MDIRRMAGVIRSRLGLIAVIVILCCLAAGLATQYLIEPKYEASVKVIVNKTSEAGMTLDDVNMNVLLTETYLELAQTEAVMGQVSSEYPEFGFDSRDLIEKVDIVAANNSQVITMTMEDKSYDRAAKIVNAAAAALQAKAAEIMKEDNITLLDRAPLDIEPVQVSPSLMLNLVIAFVLSLVIGIALAFLQEHLDETIRDEETAKQALGIPPLAVFGRIEQTTNKQGKSGARRASDNVYATANQ